jgi:hypothetical protein
MSPNFFHIESTSSRPPVKPIAAIVESGSCCTSATGSVEVPMFIMPLLLATASSIAFDSARKAPDRVPSSPAPRQSSASAVSGSVASASVISPSRSSQKLATPSPSSASMSAENASVSASDSSSASVANPSARSWVSASSA